MIVFSYKARNNAGGLVTGEVEAENEQDAIRQLHRRDYTPVKVGEVALVHSAVTVPVAPAVVRVTRVTIAELMLFCVNLSNMVGAGIPLLGALNSIAGQLGNLYFGSVVQKIALQVSEGSSLSDALEGHPRVFSPFFINMVRVGESSGTMGQVLKTLAVHMEKQEDLRQKVVGALTYPVILMTVGTGVILLILTFVIPKFAEIFSKAGVELPLATQLMCSLGIWLQHYWVLFFLILGALVLGVRQFLGTEFGKKLWHRVLLKLPIVGPLMCNMFVARFSRTFGSMLNSGVPLLRALDIVEDVIGNMVFAGIVREVRASAEKGEGIYTALEGHQEFSRDVVYMISVGEKSGRIGEMLNKVADFYELKVEFAIKQSIVFIEPVFISFLGICVGTMLASVILPMFDLVKTIQR